MNQCVIAPGLLSCDFSYAFLSFNFLCCSLLNVFSSYYRSRLRFAEASYLVLPRAFRFEARLFLSPSCALQKPDAHFPQLRALPLQQVNYRVPQPSVFLRRIQPHVVGQLVTHGSDKRRLRHAVPLVVEARR